MNLKSLLSVPSQSTCASLSLLALRCTGGIAFMLHGWGKIQNPFSWMGPDAKTPALFMALAAISEFFGGLAWIIGLLTPIASFGIVCTMAVAVYMHAIVMGDPFVSKGGGSYELAAIYLCIGLVLMLVGPGRFSLDHKLFDKR